MCRLVSRKLGVLVTASVFLVQFRLAGNSCELADRGTGVLAREAGQCQGRIVSNGRFTVAVVDGHVLRIQGGQVAEFDTHLGEQALAIYPDARGRALISSHDRVLRRVSSQGRSHQLWRAAE